MTTCRQYILVECYRHLVDKDCYYGCTGWSLGEIDQTTSLGLGGPRLSTPACVSSTQMCVMNSPPLARASRCARASSDGETYNIISALHHVPKRTTLSHKQRTQRTQQNATPPQPERGAESKPPQTVSSSPKQCHAEAAARCKPERQLELLHQGIITLKPRTHDRRSPYYSGASAEHSHSSADEKH